MSANALTCRPATLVDRDAWLLLRHSLWPDVSPGTHVAEMLALLADPSQTAFLAERDGTACGFIEASIRPWAEGCDASPVGYLEGWYVAPECRRQGVGRALVRAAETWALSRGCRWMGSDALLENTVSEAAHVALGYRVVEKLVCFIRPLAETVTDSSQRGLPLVLLPETYAVVRLAVDDALPAWAVGPFVSLTRTKDELSVVCPAAVVPPEVRQEGGWRALRVAGTLDFALVGVLASLLAPLAAAGVSVFAISTFDTDYVLVRERDLAQAVAALERAGHRVTPA